ncbi:putative heterokaryon incompatibility protein [Xylariaceae sp. FL0594]|nr:putative heterokaryon incompatibility protein [Xylariaceae sp. FL0594]
MRSRDGVQSARQQAAADYEAAVSQLKNLPDIERAGFISYLLALWAGASALCDTVLAKLGGWVLSRLSGWLSVLIAGRCVVPAGLDRLTSILLHVYLFSTGQSAWRRAATALRRLLSRDDADDILLSELQTSASETAVYVFLSVVFRNIAAIVRYLAPFLLFVAAVIALWFATVDEPAQTFTELVDKAWELAEPRVSDGVDKVVYARTVAGDHVLRLFFNAHSSINNYRDKRTAARAAALEAHRYRTLGPGEIRLLKLTKYTHWGTVRCELVPVALDRAPPFETISYTWGSQTGEKFLILDNRRFAVAERVYDIVHNRASCLMTRYLWIDSICINQREDEEKSAQVRLMRDIYGSSDHTVVWLGHAPDATDALGLLAYIAWHMRADDAVERRSRLVYELVVESPRWPALCRLMRHDYWSRCWVIQEIAVSRKIVLFYGGELVSWDYFSSLMRVLFSADFNSTWHISNIYPRDLELENLPMDAGLQVVALTNVREQIVADHAMDLFELLRCSANSTASDVRDNIYAVQGISSAAAGSASSPVDATLAPDYAAGIEHPFRMVGEHLLRRGQGLVMLHYAGVGSSRNPKLRKLPSWVPDWSVKRSSKPYWWDPSEAPPYRASAGLDPIHAITISAPDGSTLVLSGVMLVDHIVEPGPRFFGVSENGVVKKEKLPGVYKDYAACLDMATEGSRRLNEPYITGIPLIEALWRTLTCDRNTDDLTRPANPSLSQHYQALVNLIAAYTGALGPDLDPSPLSDPGFLASAKGVQFLRAWSLYSTSAGRFGIASAPYTRERMFAVTQSGYMGLVPPFAEAGDVVCIIPGAQVPFLLRSCGDGEGQGFTRWQLVGETYFHGMMDAEMIEQGVAETIELC